MDDRRADRTPNTSRTPHEYPTSSGPGWRVLHAGGCSRSSFVKTFKRGRVVPPNQSFERELTNHLSYIVDGFQVLAFFSSFQDITHQKMAWSKCPKITQKKCSSEAKSRKKTPPAGRLQRGPSPAGGPRGGSLREPPNHGSLRSPISRYIDKISLYRLRRSPIHFI